MARRLFPTLMVLFFTMQIAIFAVPRVAHAQFVVSAPVLETQGFLKSTLEKAKDVAGSFLKKMTAIAYRNGLSTFLGQFAYDAAVKLSSGGAGQQPLFKFDKSYWSKLADSAAADYLDTLSQDSGFLKNGLCEPIDPLAKLNITLAVQANLPGGKTPRKPRCSLENIKQNIKAVKLRKLKDYVSFTAGEGSVVRTYKENVEKIIKSDNGIDTLVRDRLLRLAEILKSVTDDLERSIKHAKENNISNFNAAFAPTVAKMLDASVHLSKDYTLSHTLDVRFPGKKDQYEEIKRVIQPYCTENIDCSKKRQEELEFITELYNNEIEYISIAKSLKFFLDPQEYITELRHRNTDTEDLDYSIFLKDLFSVPDDEWPSVEFCKPDGLVIQSETDLLNRGNVPNLGGLGGVLNTANEGINNRVSDTGKSDEEKIKNCKERTRRYLEKLDGWYQALYSIVDDLNKDRRAGTIDTSNIKTDLQDLANIFNTESNTLGATLTLTSQANSDAAKKVEESKFFQSLQGITDSVTSTVSGVVKTPSTLVNEYVTGPLRNSPNQYLQYTGEAVADAVGIFTNTLLSRMVKRLFDGTGANPSLNPDGAGVSKKIPSRGGVAIAQKRYAGLGAPYFKQFTQLDAVELLSRPGAAFGSGSENFIDANFAQAIREQLTVREAIQRGLLHKEWKFGYESRGVEPNVGNGYPYRSLVWLRHYRVIPATWEVVAQYIAQYDGFQTKTLGELVDLSEKQAIVVKSVEVASGEFKPSGSLTLNSEADEDQLQIKPYEKLTFIPTGRDDIACTGSYYDTAGTESGVVLKLYMDAVCQKKDGTRVSAIQAPGKLVIFASNPYYGLVDPNWVLKAPALQCGREGAGEQIISKQEVSDFSNPNGPKQIELTRANYCADEQTCVVEDDAGNCKRFGYCTLEKDSWKFGEENTQCLPEFNTCQTFSKQDGQQVSYLADTVQTVHCAKQDAGCQPVLRVSNSQNSSLLVPTVGTADIEVDENFDPLSRIQSVPGNGEFWCSVPGGARCRISAGKSSCAIVDATGEQVAICSVSSSTDQKSSAITYFNNKIQTCSAESAGCQKYLRVKSTVNDAGAVVNPTPQDSKDFIDAYTDNEYPSDQVKPFYLNGNRGQCTEAAVGCQLYQPISGSGKPVAAQLQTQDQCSAMCVGFNQYLEKETFFEQSPLANRYASFIPSKAQSCSVADVGCEEFTSIQSDQTAEKKYYLTSAQLCTLPTDPNVKSYFVWEGNNILGFQLRRFQYLQSNQQDSDGGEPPCVKTTVAENGATVCVDDKPNLAQCSQADSLTNPVCREFIDVEGRSYFAKQDELVVVSPECATLRSTNLIEGIASKKFNALVGASKQCVPQAVSCRKYEGTQAGNDHSLISNRFTDGTLGGWIGDVNPYTDANGQRGIRLPESGTQKSVTIQKSNIAIQAGERYVLALDYSVLANDAKKDITLNAVIQSASGDVSLGGINLIFDNQWHTNQLIASIGPLGVSFDAIIKIVVASDAPVAVALDTTQMQTQNDVYYVLKNSIDPSDATQCGGQLGCRAYNTVDSATGQSRQIYARRFSQVCDYSKGDEFRDKELGCEALINTNNNTEIDEVEYGQSENKITVPKDFVEYVRNVPSAQCKNGARDMGCQLVAGPGVTNSKLTSFQARYIVDDPSQYEQTLCSTTKAVQCQVYKDSNEQEVVFKDPRDRICEYGGSGGWVVAGTGEPCPQKFGQSMDKRLNYQIPDKGYVGVCNTEQAGCTELMPTSSNGTDESDGQSFFVLDKGDLAKGGACSDTDEKNGICKRFRKYYPAMLGKPEKSDPSPDKRAPLYKVRKDRVCGEWLECRSGTTVVGPDGKEASICLDRYACSQWGTNGECKQVVDDNDIRKNLTYQQPTVEDIAFSESGTILDSGSAGKAQRVIDFDEFMHRSGLSRPGLRFNSAASTFTPEVTGNNHPVLMSIEGETAKIANFDFERDTNSDLLPDGWIVQPMCYGACGLEKKDVKSGAYSLRIGSPTAENIESTQISRFSTVAWRGDGKTVLGADTYKRSALYVFSGNIQSTVAQSDTITLRYRFFDPQNIENSSTVFDGWAKSDDSPAGPARTFTETIPTNATQRFFHSFEVPSSKNAHGTFVVIDVIKATVGTFQLSGLLLQKEGTRMVSAEQSFENTAVGGFPSGWYKSIGCRQQADGLCAVTSGKALQINIASVNEEVCAQGANIGKVCRNTSDCGRGASGSCESNAQSVAFVVKKMQTGNTYTVSGKYRINNGFFEVVASAYTSGNASAMRSKYGATEWFTQPSEFGQAQGSKRFSSSDSAQKEFRYEFELLPDKPAGQEMDVALVFRPIGKSVELDDIKIEQSSSAFNELVWRKVPCLDARCNQQRGDVSISGILTTTQLPGGEHGMSMPVKTVSPQTPYVLSGWINTKGLEQSSIGQVAVIARQFSSAVPPDDGTAKAVAQSASVAIKQVGIDRWVFFTSEFTTSPQTHSLRIDLPQNISGSILFDDIQLKPVLRVARKELARDAAPSCRLYPTDTAPQCDAITDTGAFIRGWKGYCMEYDPSDPTHCMQWYPVDVIKDETNIFTKPETVGYQGPGPVYHCAVAKEKEPAVAGKKISLPRLVCAQARGNGGEDDAGCYTVALVSDPKPAFYTMESSDWRIGIDAVPVVSIATAKNNIRLCRQDLEDKGFCSYENQGCWDIEGRESNRDTKFAVFKALEGGVPNVAPCVSMDASECYTRPLQEIYHKIMYFKWSRGRESCAKSAHVTGYDLDIRTTLAQDKDEITDADINPTAIRCADPYCDRSDDTVFDNFANIYHYAGKGERLSVANLVGYLAVSYISPLGLIGVYDTLKGLVDGSISAITPQQSLPNLFAQVPSKQRIARVVRPLECSTLVKTVDNDGENMAWNSRINGSYQVEAPIKFGSNKQCLPFSAAPSFSDPSDITMMVDTNDDLVPDLPVRTPLTLYTPGDKDNNDLTKICSESHRGNWAFAYDAVMTTCIGGARAGSVCFSNTDCPAGRCSDKGNVYVKADKAKLGTPCPSGVTLPAGEQCGGVLDKAGSGVVSIGKGVGRILNVFAKIFDVFQWNKEEEKYESVDFPLKDKTSECVGGVCSPDVLEMRVNGVPVFGGSAQPPIIRLGDTRTAQLAFTTRVPQDHLPIKAIDIDWGDGGEWTRQGNLGLNHRQDMSRPHIYTHVYQNTVKDISIRIRVTDNWGWCNGGYGPVACEGSSGMKEYKITVVR